MTYLFIQHNNVYVMTASRQNCNAASLFLFLHRVVDVSWVPTICLVLQCYILHLVLSVNILDIGKVPLCRFIMLCVCLLAAL